MPSRPPVVPIWTVGNAGARTQPTDGEQFTGFVPNFRPPSKWHNWLFGEMSDWIAWLDYVTTTPSAFPVSNVGHNILTGTTLQAQLDECDAFLSSLGLQPLTISATGNPLVYHVSPVPLNQAQPLIFLDGLDEEPTSDFSWSVVGGVGIVTFVVAPSAGQTPVAIALTANNPGSGGANVSGGYVTYGDAASPQTVVAAAGITEPGDQRAMIFTVSAGGITPITSTPQITPGTKVGQELVLVGTSDTNAISLVSGNGLFLRGPITLTAGVLAAFYWNGTVWAEDYRNN